MCYKGASNCQRALVSPAIRLQLRHHHGGVMGDPGLLQELPDIAALLPQGCGDREQAAAADGTAC